MESQELDPVEIEDEGVGCDESNCVSQGGWNHISSDTSKPFMNPFTCYGDDGKFYPRMCANGFVPVLVEGEQRLSSADWYGNLDANITVSYFTCCPPTRASSRNASRHCSDPKVGRANDTSNDTPCNAQDTRNVPRQTETNLMTDWSKGVVRANYTVVEIDSYVCCDSIPTVDNVHGNSVQTSKSSSTRPISPDFWNDTDCVPYRSDFYDGFLRENQLGNIVPITCDFSDGSFPVPRPSPTGRFQCCKNGTAMEPFVHDSAFNMTVYPIFMLWIISAVLSMIGFTALLIPLVKDLKNGKQSQKKSEPRFSPYNLYLVYLLFLDLFYSLLMIGWCSSYINQNYNPNFEGVLAGKESILRYGFKKGVEIGWYYVIGNLSINALITHQVLFFLKTYRSGRRIKPPSLTRVNLQAGGVYAMILVIGTIFFLLTGDSNRMNCRIGMFVWQVLAYPPLLYGLWVPIRIWWLGYMPSVKKKESTVVSSRSSIKCRNSNALTMSAVREKAIRELAIYFLRVVLVFVGIWIPGTFITYIPNLDYYSTWFVANCFFAIQPIVTFGFFLAKSDVREYVLNLVSCFTRGSNAASLTDSALTSSTISRERSKDTRKTSNMMSDSRIGSIRNARDSIAPAVTSEDPERGQNTRYPERESTCFFIVAGSSEYATYDDTNKTIPKESSASIDDDHDFFSDDEFKYEWIALGKLEKELQLELESVNLERESKKDGDGGGGGVQNDRSSDH